MTPFVAFNGRVREDEDVGGDVNFQAGWLRRGILGQTLRYGLRLLQREVEPVAIL